MSEIDNYISKLQYDKRQLLAVPGDDVTTMAAEEERQKTDDGVIVIRREKRTLSAEFGEGLILAPITDIVFPGNLVAINKNLADGVPNAIRLRRSNKNITVKLDLPGMDQNGTLEIPGPVTQAGVQGAIDGAIQQWIETKRPQGYQTKSDIVFSYALFANEKQASAQLGFSYTDMSTSLKANLSGKHEQNSKVLIVMMKQIYCTAVFSMGNSIKDLLADDVTLDDMKAAITDKNPAGYVSEVDYGRIVFFKMETKNTVSDVEAMAALKASTVGGAEISADLKAKYSSIINESRVSVITLGGNVTENIKLVDARDFESLSQVITSNKSVNLDVGGSYLPISYAVKDLKDSSLAKRSMSTEYVVENSTYYPNGFVALSHHGAYVAKFRIKWENNGKEFSWNADSKTQGFKEKILLPGSANNIEVEAWAYTGLVWDPTGQICLRKYPTPPNTKLTVTGTTLNRSYTEKTYDR